MCPSSALPKPHDTQIVLLTQIQLSRDSFKPIHYVVYPNGDDTPDHRRSRIELVFEPKRALQGTQWRREASMRPLTDEETKKIKNEVVANKGKVFRLVDKTRQRIEALDEFPNPPERIREEE